MKKKEGYGCIYFPDVRLKERVKEQVKKKGKPHTFNSWTIQAIEDKLEKEE